MNRKQARRNFEKVVQGKRPRAEVELAEAKAHLRRVDEDLNISPAFVSLSKGDWQSALIAFAPMALDEVKKEYLLVPLLIRALPFFYQVVFTSQDKQ